MVRRAGQTNPFHTEEILVLSHMLMDTEFCDRCTVPQPVPSWDVTTSHLHQIETGISATAQLNRWVNVPPSF